MMFHIYVGVAGRPSKGPICLKLHSRHTFRYNSVNEMYYAIITSSGTQNRARLVGRAFYTAHCCPAILVCVCVCM